MKCSLIVFVALASSAFAAPRAQPQLSNVIAGIKEDVVQGATDSKCASLCAKYQTPSTQAYCPKVCNAAAAGWAAAQAHYKE
ncbi:BQ5605_C004g02918 [Microbotryum silenes-dioicae]|uniref:BQ5605_C004g02918 protein n=1 Tax=Microbotryum silenes-dioicae TaxID=796604 RepID=A0A2X0MDP8_9BASI|nr:BQ5605_C004g02918 [Microbotryum silenes-dioicae]